MYFDITFRGLSHAVSPRGHISSSIVLRILEAMRAFRESREMQSWEARFRHLAAIVEDLVKENPEDAKEWWKGNAIRNRIAKMATNGWKLFVDYGSSALTPQNLSPEGFRAIRQRQEEMGWSNPSEAGTVVDDLWTNVRNPFSHSMGTFLSLKRDPVQDVMNLERIVITIVNGLYAAYQVEDLYDNRSVYDILING